MFSSGRTSPSGTSLAACSLPESPARSYLRKTRPKHANPAKYLRRFSCQGSHLSHCLNRLPFSIEGEDSFATDSSNRRAGITVFSFKKQSLENFLCPRIQTCA